MEAVSRIERRREWVVYAKRPFGGPQQVLDYLGRYTHRVAISNQRLLQMEDGMVSFQWKDYRDHSRQKVMTLAADAFIRRFLLHVLPKGFQRIRQYGFLAVRSRTEKLARCRELLAVPVRDETPVAAKGWRERYEAITGESLDRCPRCHGRMMSISMLLPGQDWHLPIAAIDSSCSSSPRKCGLTTSGNPARAAVLDCRAAFGEGQRAGLPRSKPRPHQFSPAIRFFLAAVARSPRPRTAPLG